VKVTKYPQSCLLLEKEGRRIVIDPGNFFAAKYSVDDLGAIEAVIYTHQHGDHYDASIAEEFKSKGIPLYGNSAVAGLIGVGSTVVRHRESFTIGGFDITPHDLPHFAKEGVVMPSNTGYIIDGNFFHPGDGIKTEGVQVHDFAAPVGGPFDYQVIKDFALSLQAKIIIPIHFTNVAMYPCDTTDFTEVIGDSAEVIVLNDGQAVEL